MTTVCLGFVMRQKDEHGDLTPRKCPYCNALIERDAVVAVKSTTRLAWFECPNGCGTFTDFTLRERGDEPDANEH